MNSIHFSNGSRIDLYVGGSVYRDIQITDVEEDYGETETITIVPQIVRGRIAKPQNNKSALHLLDKEY